MSGATIQQTATIALSPSGWSAPLTFDRFDPSTGTLQDVSIGLSGTVDGSVSIENLGAIPADISFDVNAGITVSSGDTRLLTVAPDAHGSVALGASAAGPVFGGSSGTVVAGIANTATAISQIAPAPGIATAFVGTGTLGLTGSGTTGITEFGNGNLLSVSSAEAGADVGVQYQY